MIAFIETTSDSSTTKNTYLLPHGDRVRQGNGFSLHILLKNDYQEMPNQFSVEAGTINGTDCPNAIPIYSTERNRGYVFHRLYPTELTYGLKDNDSCTEFVINVPRDSEIVTNSGSIGLIIKGYNANGENVIYAQNAILAVEKVFAKPRERSNISLSQADSLAAMIVNNFHPYDEMFVMQAPGNGAGSDVKLSARAANGFGIVSGKVVISEDIESTLEEETIETVTGRLIYELRLANGEYFTQQTDEAVENAVAALQDKDFNVWIKNNVIDSVENKAVGKILCTAQTASLLSSIAELNLITGISKSESAESYGQDDSNGYRYVEIDISYKKTRASDWELIGRAETTGRIKMTSPSVSFADSLGYGEFRLTYRGPDNTNAKGYIELWIQRGVTEILAGTEFDLTIPVAIALDDEAEQAFDDFVGTNDVISGHDVEYLAKENNLVIAKSLTENINGYLMTPNYSADPSLNSETVSIGGVNYERTPIKYGDSALLTENQLKHYLLCMTGSERVPMYDYDRPLNTFVMIATGDLYKLQAEEVTDGFNLYAWKVNVPYVSTSNPSFSGLVTIKNENDGTKTNDVYTADNGIFTVTNGTATWQFPDEGSGVKTIATRTWANTNLTKLYKHNVTITINGTIYYIGLAGTKSTSYESFYDIVDDFNYMQSNVIVDMKIMNQEGEVCCILKITDEKIVYVDEENIHSIDYTNQIPSIGDTVTLL